MKWQDVIIEAFQRQAVEMEKAVSGLSVADLNTVPAPDCNTIGWLAWHVIRSLDRNMSEVMEEEQLWTRDKWHDRWGRAADPGETGVGHTEEQVKAFRSPAADDIIAYHRAILSKILKYIETRLDEKELGRQSYSPTFKKTELVGTRITAQFFHANHHIGQADYARGILRGQGKGKGWFGR
jgi:hypothetical protein